MIKQTKIYYGILSNNRTELLKKTINSILTSNIKDFGIVISDNCSDDSTILFLKSLLNNQNIHIIFNKDKSLEKNKSYGRNRIIDKVLELSKGDSNTYLRFIDDDDYFNSIGLKLEYNKISESKNKDIYFVKRVTRENFNTFNKNRDVNPNLMFEGTHTIYINNRLLKEYPNIRYDEINHPIYKEDLIFFVTLISKVFSYDDFEDNEVLKLNLDFSYYYVKTCRLTQNKLKTLNSYFTALGISGAKMI